MQSSVPIRTLTRACQPLGRVLVTAPSRDGSLAYTGSKFHQKLQRGPRQIRCGRGVLLFIRLDEQQLETNFRIIIIIIIPK
jgi:hypothetical protein